MINIIEIFLASFYGSFVIMVFGAGYLYHWYWSFNLLFVDMRNDGLIDQVLVIAGILIPPIGGINGSLRFMY